MDGSRPEYEMMDLTTAALEDVARRADEFAALQAIYGEDDVTAISATQGPWKIRLGPRAVLQIMLPSDYPSTGAPTPLIRAAHLEPGLRELLTAELVDMCGPDTDVAILWAEHCREALVDVDSSKDDGGAGVAEQEGGKGESAKEGSSDGLQVSGEDAPVAAAAAAAAAAAVAAAGDGTPEGTLGECVRTFRPATSKYGQRVRHFDGATLLEANRRTIYRGDAYHPPRSGPSETFVAFVAAVQSMDHVNWVLAELLLNDKKVGKATHNMIAYRFHDPGRGCHVADNDDDGEKGAGTKLAALLEMTNARDVLVVVSRWFGGVLLGPSRFKYIAAVARTALEQAGFVVPPASKKL